MKEIFIVTVCIIIIILIIYYEYKYQIRKNFKKIYGFEEIPKSIKVKRYRNKSEYNYYELVYPCWVYENKDGTQDKRRNGNYIIWNDSFLYLPKYKISCKTPYKLVQLVNILRIKGIDIEKNNDEQKKYDKIKREKNFRIKCNNIENIIRRFKENPIGFEEFVAEFYEEMGYKAFVTSKTNDGGYDIKLYKNGLNCIVECKCFALGNNVGRPMIQKLVGANQKEKAEVMIFITTSDFSKGAREYAEEIGVKLINGNDFINLMQKNQKIEIKYEEVKLSEWQLTKSDLIKNVAIDLQEYI